MTKDRALALLDEIRTHGGISGTDLWELNSFVKKSLELLERVQTSREILLYAPDFADKLQDHFSSTTF